MATMFYTTTPLLALSADAKDHVAWRVLAEFGDVPYTVVVYTDKSRHFSVDGTGKQFTDMSSSVLFWKTCLGEKR